MIEILVIGLYIFFLLFIFLYALTELNLVKNYLWDRFFTSKTEASNTELDEFPVVTIQLPIYNELYVIERLIDRVTEFEWPKDKLEIQLLDDSNDETVQIVADRVAYWKERGFDIEHIRREERTGFKAGALAYGLEVSKGEFVAIFDADFLPERDFLKQSVPKFLANEKIGVVQSRWGHINRDYSLLTKVQAFALDAHFTIEQRGRNSKGHFINFNGTAGIWRKVCIEDAGGWQSDTLTEDLDLSYRAQVRGWKFVYMENLESPAELPVTMSAIKSQQFRWAKGAAECTRKNLWMVLKQRGIGFSTKLNAIFHLLNSFLYICVIGLVLLSLPVIEVIHRTPEYGGLYSFLSFFFISTIILGIIYFIPFVLQEGNKFLRVLSFIFFFPMFLAISMGIGLYNSMGVLEGYIGKKSPFVRTPKFNVNAKGDAWKGNKYTHAALNKVLWMEVLVLLYAIVGLYFAILYGNMNILAFLVMIIIGFSSVVYFSLRHSLVSQS